MVGLDTSPFPTKLADKVRAQTANDRRQGISQSNAELGMRLVLNCFGIFYDGHLLENNQKRCTCAVIDATV